MPFRKTVPIAILAMVCSISPALAPPALAQFETRGMVSAEPYAPYSAVVGDFNRDGTPDVALINYLRAGSVEILLGNGDGTFRPGTT